MFTYVHDNKGETPAIELRPVGSAAISLGQALVITGGALVSSTGATTPQYIAQADAAANADACPVVRVTPYQKWLTTLSVDNTQSVGTACQIATDGGRITATTGGHAVIDYKFGTSSGDKVIVHFE